MGRWGDSGMWVGKDLRREVFFFPSQGVDLFGSIYAPPAPGTPPLGVVFCNSWGHEGNQASRIVHWVSLSVALAGGVAVNFHYPGFGDSGGDAGGTTIDVLASASLDAIQEAERRYPETRWVLAGLMFGASVAALAADRGARAEHLLLVQPALRPAQYFARLERVSRRSIGQPPPVDGFAFGYPLSPALLNSASTANPAVEAALNQFAGGGMVIRYEKPTEIEGVPASFDHVCVPGAWRFGIEETPELIRATSKWLRKDSGMLPQ